MESRPIQGGASHVPELEVLNGVAAGTVFVLGDVPAVLGRSPEAHLQIGDPWISSMHAMFERRDDGIWVVDLESRNGTFVADERIEEARVTDGSVVRLGRTEVRLSAAAVAGPPSPSVELPPRPRPHHRDTGRSDPAIPVRGLAREPGHDPHALTARAATVLRIALDAAGLEAYADAADRVRAGLDAAAAAGVEAGGVVAHLAGIGLLVIFGLEGPPEPDDPERAVSVARSARQALLAKGVSMRAAVDTGHVLAGRPGGVGRFDLVALGPAAERVERLLALARPGEILAGAGAAPARGLTRLGLVTVGGTELEVFKDQ
jgi:class 3 adenylate cyclase